MFQLKTALALSCASWVLGVPSIAIAQQSDNAAQSSTQAASSAHASPAASSNSAGQIDDIVVTAQRRAESSQSVPISIMALPAARVEALGITSTENFAGKIPGLNISRISDQNKIFMRGVGTSIAGGNIEQSTAIYVDDVYIYSSFGGQFALNSVERVEVLKGPQGTLFGRNATAGVIQIITKDPSFDPSGNISVGYANYDTATGSAYLTGGITDTLAANASATFRNQGRGWGRNITLDNDNSYKFSNFAASGKLRFTPSDKTDIVLQASYQRDRTAGDNMTPRPGVRQLNGTIYNLKPYDAATNLQRFYLGTGWTFALRVNQDLGWAHLKSVSAYRKVKTHGAHDEDAAEDIFQQTTIASQPSENIQQEIILNGSIDSLLDWNVGGFFFKGKAGFDPVNVEGSLIGPSTIFITGIQHVNSKSLFAQADLHLTDTTKVTAGIRQTWETIRRTDSHYDTGGVRLFDIPDQRASYQPLTFRLGIDQKIGPDALVYATYTRGTKSGGFNILSPTPDPAYLPEKLDSAEVGFKSELFDRALRLNASAFYYWYKDIQIQTTIVGGFTVSNAASARVYGLDADLEWAITPELRFTANGNYTHGKYRDFPNAAGFPSSALEGPAFSFDASGNWMIFTPKFSGGTGLSYTGDTSFGQVIADVNVAHFGSNYAMPSNRLKLPAYTTLNGSLTFALSDDKYRIRLWALNLTDDRYLINIQENALGDTVVYAPPRTFGVTISSSF